MEDGLKCGFKVMDEFYKSRGYGFMSTQLQLEMLALLLNE